MELRQAEEKVYFLMRMHGVDHIKFEFDRGKNRFGAVRFNKATGLPIRLTLSAPLTERNDEHEVTNVILHEIAHAMSLIKYRRNVGHGPEWKAIARSIGCTGDRCHSAPGKVDYLWTGTCPQCAKTVGRHRLNENTRQMACSTCCKNWAGGKWSPLYLFEWRKNAN